MTFSSFSQMKSSIFDINLAAAGISHCLCLTGGSPDEWRHLLDVNVVALCLCTKEAVASMQRRSVQDGHIFNLSRSVHSALEHLFVIEGNQIYSVTCTQLTSQHGVRLRFLVDILGPPEAKLSPMQQTVHCHLVALLLH